MGLWDRRPACLRSCRGTHPLARSDISAFYPEDAVRTEQAGRLSHYQPHRSGLA